MGIPLNTRWYIIPILLLLAGGAASGQQSGATQPPDPREPQNLDWELTQEGLVRLFWDAPKEGVDNLDRYEIWRKQNSPSAEFVLVANTDKERQYIDLSVKPGDSYRYEVWAYYYSASPFGAATTVTYPSTSTVFEIVSTPPTTINAGDDYQYFIELNADPRITTITAHVEGEGAPAGVDAYNIVGAMKVIWNEPQSGVYDFTLVVTGVLNGQTVIAKQQIHLIVSPRTGYIDISVRNIAGEPIPFSQVQLMLLPEDLTDTRIPVKTNEEGNAKVDFVPVGQLVAYCYPGDDRYQARYYNQTKPATSLSDAELLTLGENDVLSLVFTLQSIGDERANVGGTINADETGTPVANAKVHFIRKSNFILIGDHDLKDNPTLIENWKKSKIDTTVFTNQNGVYSASMPVGIDYFIVVEKEGFFESFNPSLYYNTNALEARPFRTERYADRTFNYRIVEKEISTNSVQGVIRREDDNQGEPATVLLIERDLKLKRGTGGGATYSFYKDIRSVLTDSNGVYEFKNIPTNNYILLAIPLNRNVVPQYYTGHISGAMTFENSQDFYVSNTVQGKDFKLRNAVNDGLGAIYGIVLLEETTQTDKDTSRLSGALVCAINPDTDQIVGYSISDELGRYTIPNLRPGLYHVIADHPRHGFDQKWDIDLRYTSVEDEKRTQFRTLIIDIHTTGIDDFDPSAVPASIVLEQNYPNPFNPSTNLKFGLNKRMSVKLAVFNAFGQEMQILQDGELAPGTYSMKFDATNLASGMYYYRLSTGDQILTRSMMLVK